MKNLVLILVLGLMFISQDVAFAQKKSKKIESYEISDGTREWQYCLSNGYSDVTCIDKMRITFENNSQYHVSSITFMLNIKSR